MTWIEFFIVTGGCLFGAWLIGKIDAWQAKIELTDYGIMRKNFRESRRIGSLKRQDIDEAYTFGIINFSDWDMLNGSN